MTKAEYAEYLRSEHWQNFRATILQERATCGRCGMQRWLATLLYHQDLNLHHLTYASIGSENTCDVEVLCRRCHELATFGTTELKKIRSYTCNFCYETHFNRYSNFCEACDKILNTHYLMQKTSVGPPIWKATMTFSAGRCINLGLKRNQFLFEAEDSYDGIVDLAHKLV